MAKHFDPVQTLPRNTEGRDFVVGDIHGCFSLLKKTLDHAGFDEGKDRLISVGDLTDRGPESARSLEFLGKHWFYSVRGNHDDMILRVLYFANGTLDRDTSFHRFDKDECFDLFFDDISRAWVRDLSRDQRFQFIEAFESLPIALEIQTEDEPIGVVHAEVFRGMNWHEFLAQINQGDPYFIYKTLWGRTRLESQDQTKVEGIKRVFSGHTVQNNIAKLGNCFFIDTGAVFSLFSPDTAMAGALHSPHMTMVDISAEETRILAGRKKAVPSSQHPFHII